MKTIISLSFCLLFTLSVKALNFTVGNLSYTTNLDGTSVYVAPNQSRSLTGAIVIPASVSYSGKYYAVTSIGSQAFDNCSGITAVTIPSSVTSIGWYAFDYCTGLTSVTIPSSVTTIDDSAFEDCTGLTSITIPSSVTSLGDYTFEGCSRLVSVTIPSSITSLGDYTFHDCGGLTSVSLPSSITLIGDHAFDGCIGLTSVTIPSNVTSIGNSAFYYCSGLTSVSIPSNVSSIGIFAFQGCSGLTSFLVDANNRSFSVENNVLFSYDKRTLVAYPTTISGTTYTIPSSVSSIRSYAFGYCTGLTSVTIPSNVTSIGAGAFFHCTGLTSVTIPSSVTTIGAQVFYYCTGLREIHNDNPTPQSIAADVLYGIDKTTCTLYVPVGSYSNYSVATGWKDFSTISEGVNTFSVSSSCNNGGSVTKSSSSVILGNPVTFTISPDLGYEIDSVTLNGIDIKSEIVNNSYTVSSVNKNLTLVVAFAFDVVDEDNTFYIDNMTARPGKQITIPIRMNNVTNITAFQCKLYLPEGLTYAKDESDEYLISLSDRAAKSHSIGYSLQTDSSMMITALSSQNAFFTGSDGDLIYVTVNVPEEMADGVYSIEMKNIILTEKDASNISIAHKTNLISSALTIKSYDPGDSNGDGEVNIMDAVNVIDYALGNNPAPFIFETSDINDDGMIDIMDAVGTIDIIMGKTVYSAGALSKNSALSADLFEMDPLYIKAGETKTFALRLKNTKTYTAFQLDVKLPDGLSIAKDDEGNNLIETSEKRRTSSHVTGSNVIADGKIRVIGYSMNNSLYRGSEGDFVYITVRADASVQSNETKLTVDNIHFVTANRTDNQLDAYSGDVFIGKSISGLEGVEISDFEAYTKGGILYVQSPEDLNLTLYSLDGRMIRMLSVKVGENSFTDLDKGVYVVNGLKVIIK